MNKKKRTEKNFEEKKEKKNQTKIDNIIKEGEGSSQQKSPRSGHTRAKGSKRRGDEKNVKSSSFRYVVLLFRVEGGGLRNKKKKRRAVWFIILKDPVASLYANYVRRIVILYSVRVLFPLFSIEIACCLLFHFFAVPFGSDLNDDRLLAFFLISFLKCIE